MIELRFTVPGKPVPKVRMTQGNLWTDKVKRSLQYQRLVRAMFLSALNRLSRDNVSALAAEKYYRVDINVYLSAVRVNEFLCPCGRR